VLFRNERGEVNQDFVGKLSYSWPRHADQTPLNRGDAGYDPLFAYGYGLSYAHAMHGGRRMTYLLRDSLPRREKIRTLAAKGPGRRVAGPG